MVDSIKNKQGCNIGKDNIEKPLISVVVPVYNVERYLSRCLDSLIHQTYENIEVLLVDDGSIDSSGKIADEYAKEDSRVRVFHISNSGVSGARNFALDNMTGEYVTFVDSDDWLETDWIENAFYSLKKANVMLYIGGYVKSYSDSEDRITHQYLPRSILTRYECMREMYTKSIDKTSFAWEVCGKLFHKKLWENVRFDTNISVQEDGLAFWHVLQLVADVLYVPVYNYHYFDRDDSAVNTVKAKNIYDDFYVNKILYNDSVLLEDYVLRDALKARFLNSRVDCLLNLSWSKYYEDFIKNEKKILHKSMSLHLVNAIKFQGIKGLIKVMLSCMPFFMLRIFSKKIAEIKGMDISL